MNQSELLMLRSFPEKTQDSISPQYLGQHALINHKTGNCLTSVSWK